MIRASGLLVAALSLASGCGSDPASEGKTTTSPTPLKVPTAAQLPVAEDFEREAQRSVNEDNVKRVIDALEKEIAADDG